MSGSLQPFDWPSAARELQQRMGVSCLEPAVLAELRSCAGPIPVLVACSGGADSVFLLCLLYAQAGPLRLDLSVAHYNHRWRGRESDADAAFVRDLAAALDLPFVEDARAENEAAFTETAARALRVAFLRAAAKARDCPYIAYGHQMDDILETQLQRLARSCGSDGLSAPRPVARFDRAPAHLRPLLGLRAGDIRMALRSLKIPWREDASNADTTISRNALRAEVIPSLFEALDRDPIAGAARSRRLLEEDAVALERLAREAVPAAYAGAPALERDQLGGLPDALLRRVLSAWLSRHELLSHFGPVALDRLIEQCRTVGTTDRYSAGAVFIRLSPEQVWIEKELYDPARTVLQATEFEPGETIVLPDGATVQSTACEVTDALRWEVMSGAIDPRHEAVLALPGELPLELRGWQPGDRFHPLGAPGSRKLKDWFIDHHVPKEERKRLPVVTTASGEIVWVPGSAPADRLKLTASTKLALRLTYRTGKPL
ncbi:MAG: tRNA lysidine(34) synthetase TilS [Opitutales bacterium]